MSDVYLGSRECEKLADGDKVTVEVDGETVWLHGSRVRR